MEFQMNGILNIADFVKFFTFKEIEKKFAKIIPFWNTQSSDKEFLWVMSKSIFFWYGEESIQSIMIHEVDYSYSLYLNVWNFNLIKYLH